MDIQLSQCFIAVDDHDKALAFYRDVLGLEVRNDVGFEGMRWVTVGSPSQPEVDIVLEPPLADHLALKREVLLQDVPLDGALNRLRLELHLRGSPQEGTRFAVRMTRDVGLGGLGGCAHG